MSYEVKTRCAICPKCRKTFFGRSRQIVREMRDNHVCKRRKS